MDRLITPAGAARLIGIKRQGLHQQVEAGKIAGIKADDGMGNDKLVAIRQSEVERYISIRKNRGK